jgi:integrase
MDYQQKSVTEHTEDDSLVLFPWNEQAAAEVNFENQALIIEWLDWQLNIRHRTPKTMTTYGVMLNKFSDWIYPQSLLEATIPQMEGFIVRPRERRAHGLIGAPGTQRRDVAILRSFYQYMWERNHTSFHKARALHSPKVHNVDPKPIPDEDWLALWNKRDLSPSDIAGLGLGYICGLRRKEIYSLQISQITPTEIVQFRRKGGKVRTLPWAIMQSVLIQKLPHLLPDPRRFVTAVDSLTNGRNGTDPLLRWTCLDESSFNKKIHQWCDELGIPRYSPHQLRHSCATNLVRAGVPIPLVSTMLAHADPQTTMRYVKAGGRELGDWLAQHG